MNATLPQLLSDEGKLRVRPLAETASLRYCRDPLAAARALKVRVLVVKFDGAGTELSTCHLELISVVTGFLLWGMEIGRASLPGIPNASLPFASASSKTFPNAWSRSIDLVVTRMPDDNSIAHAPLAAASAAASNT